MRKQRVSSGPDGSRIRVEDEKPLTTLLLMIVPGGCFPQLLSGRSLGAMPTLRVTCSGF